MTFVLPVEPASRFVSTKLHLPDQAVQKKWRIETSHLTPTDVLLFIYLNPLLQKENTCFL